MNNDLKEFLSTLFFPEEQIVAARYLSDTNSVSQLAAMTRPTLPQWISVNPINGRRLMENVTSHRNFVIEYDKGLTLAEQTAFIEASGFPFNTAVFSGNKSVHFICALNEDVGGEIFAEWRSYLDAIFPSADPQMKDPGRFTRAPGVKNGSTGKLQQLVELRPRKRSPKDLIKFFERNMHLLEQREKTEARRRAAFEERKASGQLSSWAQSFLRGEVKPSQGKSRHQTLYGIACDLCDVVAMPYEQALATIEAARIAQGVDRENEAESIVNHVYFKRRNRG